MMTSRKHLAAIFLAGVACTALSAQAMAKPLHHKKVRATATLTQSWTSADQDSRYPQLNQTGMTSKAQARQARRRGKADTAIADVASMPIFGASDLVSTARQYIGGNPTGRGSLWCGAFMDMVLKKTGHRGGGNLARAYAQYGKRVPGPQVGAIAVMGRKGGGHVGVVSGIDSSGNPIIISGNHNNKVEESVYPRGRIIAYVMPE